MASSAIERIALFAKPPIVGQTKSRLAADVGDQAAADLSAAMLADLLAQCQALQARRPTVQVELWYPPGFSPDDFPGTVRPDIFRTQQGDDLGDRLIHAFATGLTDSARMIVIGSDCITISAELLEQALDSLADAPSVFQPADDGGYVLVGLNQPAPELFRNIPWGGKQVWAATQAAATHTSAVLPHTFDIDTVDDLPRLRSFLEHTERPRTTAILASRLYD